MLTRPSVRWSTLAALALVPAFMLLVGCGGQATGPDRT
jgi:hypothetical protein